MPKHPEHILCKLPVAKEKKNDLLEVTSLDGDSESIYCPCRRRSGLPSGSLEGFP